MEACPDENELMTVRMDAVRLHDERLRMQRALDDGLSAPSPHAHLSHRRTPITSSERSRDRLLGAWAIVSTPIVVYLVAGLFKPELTDRPLGAVVLLVLVLGIEAFTRGFLLAYAVRVVIVIGLVALAGEFADHWQLVSYWVLVSLAVVVLVVNLRDALRR